MKRKIIKIDEDLCNGCGNCITDCAEGALQIINGKAKLTKESMCDGMGMCIGSCPTGALTIAEEDVEPFVDPVHQAAKLDSTAQVHASSGNGYPGMAGGCPGSKMMNFFEQNGKSRATPDLAMTVDATPTLQQWPIQLHLVPPTAPFFDDRELVVMSTCSPVAFPGINQRYVKHRAIVLACPKLDRVEGYVEKLTEILSNPSIPKVIITRMEVPCCGGLSMMVDGAASQSGRTDLVIEEVTIGLRGQILNVRSWLAKPNVAKNVR